MANSASCLPFCARCFLENKNKKSAMIWKSLVDASSGLSSWRSPTLFYLQAKFTGQTPKDHCHQQAAQALQYPMGTTARQTQSETQRPFQTVHREAHIQQCPLPCPPHSCFYSLIDGLASPIDQKGTTSDCAHRVASNAGNTKLAFSRPSIPMKLLTMDRLPRGFGCPDGCCGGWV